LIPGGLNLKHYICQLISTKITAYEKSQCRGAAHI
jgi:hypothetical protein